VFYVGALALWAVAGAIAGAGFWVAAPLSLIGALLIWPMLAGVDDTRPETALAGFKFNAVIGAAVLLAFAIEPIWRTIRPSLGV
jgi:4-hydroxybenzoate polyprenyltransferase